MPRPRAEADERRRSARPRRSSSGRRSVCVPTTSLRRQAVLVDERDPRLRARVAGDEADAAPRSRAGRRAARRAAPGVRAQRAQVLAEQEDDRPSRQRCRRRARACGRRGPTSSSQWWVATSTLPPSSAHAAGDLPEPARAARGRATPSARRAAAPAAQPSSASATSRRWRLPTDSSPARTSPGSSNSARSSSSARPASACSSAANSRRFSRAVSRP